MKKKSESIRRKAIIDAINAKFGTQRECAKALGIDETNLSNKLNRLSSKFIYQLKNVGVIIPPLYPEMKLELKSDLVKEQNLLFLSSAQENEHLKTELSEMKKLLSLSVKRITALEEENEKLRSEIAALTAVNSGKGGGKINNK